MHNNDSVIRFGLVSTAVDRQAMHQLRYEVYCKEKRYLDASGYEVDMELDKWDDYAAHFIAKNRDGIVGTVRLIKESPFGYPIENHFSIKSPRKPGVRFAEISRLIVHPDYRRRIFQISNGLYRSMFHYCDREGITDLYAIMDDRLFAVQQRVGFPFRRITDPIPCFGCINAGYALSLAEMLESFKATNLRLYEFITGLSHTDFVYVK